MGISGRAEGAARLSGFARMGRNGGEAPENLTDLI